MWRPSVGEWPVLISVHRLREVAPKAHNNNNNNNNNDDDDDDDDLARSFERARRASIRARPMQGA
jgi:hypothetical protein